MAADGAPHHQSREGARQSPGRPPLRADGETEARRGQGLSQETSAPKLSASGLFQSLWRAGIRR